MVNETGKPIFREDKMVLGSKHGIFTYPVVNGGSEKRSELGVLYSTYIPDSVGSRSELLGVSQPSSSYAS